jgi:hypothetical protein
MPAPEAHITDKQSSSLGVIARLWWMAAGNFPLVLSIVFIAQNGGRFFQAADWVFWFALASLVLVRYVDIKFLGGCTGAGEPASVSHWIRYSAIVTACSVAVWVLAHTVGLLLAAGTHVS